MGLGKSIRTLHRAYWAEMNMPRQGPFEASLVPREMPALLKQEKPRRLRVHEKISAFTKWTALSTASFCVVGFGVAVAMVLGGIAAGVNPEATAPPGIAFAMNAMALFGKAAFFSGCAFFANRMMMAPLRRRLRAQKLAYQLSSLSPMALESELLQRNLPADIQDVIQDVLIDKVEAMLPYASPLLQSSLAAPIEASGKESAPLRQWLKEDEAAILLKKSMRRTEYLALGSALSIVLSLLLADRETANSLLFGVLLFSPLALTTLIMLKNIGASVKAKEKAIKGNLHQFSFEQLKSLASKGGPADMVFLSVKSEIINRLRRGLPLGASDQYTKGSQ